VKITIVTDADSWMNEHTIKFIDQLISDGHTVQLLHNIRDIDTGDIAFFLSLGQLVRPEKLRLHKNNIVVHASALPQGKGWSPLTWQILEGKNDIPLTLFEAVEAVDSGLIYLTDVVHYDGTELIDELRSVIADAIIRLCYKFVKCYPAILDEAYPQEGEATFYTRRTNEDSRLNPNITLREQFNLLRIVDNGRYPAFFELNGCRYTLTIHKSTQEKSQ
jgi:methionyl-tRNA formyltransferase